MKKIIFSMFFLTLFLAAFAVRRCTCGESGITNLFSYSIEWTYATPDGTDCATGYLTGNYYNFGSAALFINGEYINTFWCYVNCSIQNSMVCQNII